MRYDSRFARPDGVDSALEKIRELAGQTGPVKLMEVCGTHTMAIAKAGLKSLLPGEVSLISGPGCPVCVTPAGVMDAVLELSSRPDLILTSYGDLLRVPGTVRGDSLLRRKASGARVEAVYSPIEAVDLAQANPEQQVVFLGVGFETTAPGTAACILEAARRKLKNFSVLCLLKLTEPALRALTASPDFAVDGFLCPGHVAAITGSELFRFLPEEYGLPAVVSGFEPGDLVFSVLELMRMLAAKRPELKNEYTRLVRPEGNLIAQRAIRQVFEPCASDWRGLGEVPSGGLSIRGEYAEFDAAKRFPFQPRSGSGVPGCRCAEVIRGVLSPAQCPLFGKLCTPSDPVGPCMVSGEGACAASFRYLP